MQNQEKSRVTSTALFVSPDFKYIIFLGILDFLFFLPIFLKNDIIGNVDAYRQFLPYFLFLSENIKNFNIPYWWHYTGLGYPFAGILQNSILYLPNYPFLLIGGTVGYNLSLLFHWFFLQFCTYTYVKYLLKRSDISFFSTLFFSYSFYIIIRLDIYPLILSSGWFIISLYLFHYMIDNIKKFNMKDSFKIIVSISFCLSMNFLCGYPQFFLYNIISLLVYTIVAILNNRKVFSQLLISFLLTIILVTPLASILVLSVLEIIGYSYRNMVKDELIALSYSAAPFVIISYLVPFFLVQAEQHNQNLALIRESINYISIVTIPFLILGIKIFWKYKKWNLSYIFLLLIFSSVLVFQDYFPLINILDIPIYSEFRYHIRNFFQVNFALSIFSGIGIIYYLRMLSLFKQKKLILTIKILFSFFPFIFLSILLFLFYPVQNYYIINEKNVHNILLAFIMLVIYILAFHMSRKFVYTIIIILVIFLLEKIILLTYGKDYLINPFYKPKKLESFNTFQELSKIISNKDILIVIDKMYLPNINLLSLSNNSRVINTYEPFTNVDLYYLFGMNFFGYAVPTAFLQSIFNNIIISTYGVNTILIDTTYLYHNLFESIMKKIMTTNSNISPRKHYKKELNYELTKPYKIQMPKSNDVFYLAKIECYIPKLSTRNEKIKKIKNIQEIISLKISSYEINLNISSLTYPENEDNIYEIMIPFIFDPKQKNLEITLEYKNKQRNLEIKSIEIFSYPAFIVPSTTEKEGKTYEKIEVGTNIPCSIFKNNNSLPRVYSVERIRILQNIQEYKKQILSFSIDPSKEAVVFSDSQKIIQEYKKISGFSEILSEIQNMEFTRVDINKIKFFTKSDTIEFETCGSNYSFVVINSFYHKGWKAYINNQEVPIIRTNGIVKGIVIHPGNNKVLLKFEPEYKKIILFFWIIFLLYFVISLSFLREEVKKIL